MESFKQKFSICLNYIKNKINPDDNYQLIETQRKLYYFSRFNLNSDEFMKIYEITKKVKENTFKNLIDTMKYCCRDERQKLLAVFTICYLHFYKNFNYDNNFTFEDYFNEDLVNLCSTYKAIILDQRRFKIFCYSFYYQLLKEIKNSNYYEAKDLYKYYNPYIDTEDSSSIVQLFDNYVSKNFINDVTFNLKEMMNKNIMIPLVSTSERIVNMVMSLDKVGMDFQTVSSFNAAKTSHTNTNNVNNLSNLNMSNQDNEMEVDINIDNLDISNLSGQKFFSQRVYSELTKVDIDSDQKQIITEMSYKLDSLIDIILNKCENKLHPINMFICNIVEINSDLIRLLPEYKDISDDINLRFMMPAKNIYNFAIEIYFSLNDLYNIDLNTFMDVFKAKFPFKFDERINKCVLYFYKMISDEILKSKNKNNMAEILESTVNQVRLIWQNEIIDKGQGLKSFSSL